MSDYLIHYKKGSEKEEHKYVSRESKNGKWKYTYAKVADTSDTVPSEIKEETTSESKYYIDDDGIKRDKETGNFVWNGERPEEVEKIIEKEGTMDFENDNDANHFNQLYRAYRHSKTKHFDIEGGSEEMDNNEQKYYYLAHGEKGSEWANHLYTARKWVNGKWQYIYGKVNDALGADERERRDNAYKGYGYNALAAQKAENKLRKATSEYTKRNDQNNLYDNNGREARTRNAANTARSNNLKNYEEAYRKAADTKKTADLYKQAYDKAQSDYDKTFYGTVDKAKKTASEAGTKIAKGASRAKDIVSEYGKKTLASLGEAKDKAVAKGKDILNNLLKKRKKG